MSDRLLPFDADGNLEGRVNLQAVTFPSEGSHPIQLEGIVHWPKGDGPQPAAVVCHPHPPGGGSMHNGVVAAIARALAARGVLTLCFNFRGVGGSGGQHDNGWGERADVAGAVAWLLTQPQVDPERVCLVGYSFGAWVGLACAQTDPRIAAVAAVSLVAWHYDAEFYRSHARPDLGVEPWQFDPNFMQAFTHPKLFVSGEHDPLSPPTALRRLVERIPPPSRLQVVPGTDHFWRGCEQTAGEAVADFITTYLGQGGRRACQPE